MFGYEAPETNVSALRAAGDPRTYHSFVAYGRARRLDQPYIREARLLLLYILHSKYVLLLSSTETSAGAKLMSLDYKECSQQAAGVGANWSLSPSCDNRSRLTGGVASFREYLIFQSESDLGTSTAEPWASLMYEAFRLSIMSNTSYFDTSYGVL